MSLFQILHGESFKADLLLFCLGLTRGDCGRYRDCYLTERNIVIHTRNGGGNRECYQEVFDELSKHPNYETDEDDDFDCTYANIFFTYPDDYRDDLTALFKASPDIAPSDKWKALLVKMAQTEPSK